MKSTLSCALAGLILSSALMSAGADCRRPWQRRWAERHPRQALVIARERFQAARIADGIRNGSLTRPEIRRLVAEQRLLRLETFVMLANDGRLSRLEYYKLNRDLNLTSLDIYRQKHDLQFRR